jgi:Rrf2 family protein
MALFSTRTDYAIALLTGLARHPGYCSLRVVAKEYRLPYRYVSRLAGELKSTGYLRSREGVKGGYALVKSPKAIRVLDIIEIFEGRFEPTRCAHSQGKCPLEKQCRLKPKWHTMTKTLYQTLARYTIADFL